MKKQKKKPITAAEAMEQLNADPQFVEQRSIREAEQDRLAQELDAAQVPILEDLGRVGIKVQSVWELVNTRASYTAALPVLFRHLQRRYPAAIMDGIARALAVPAAAFAWPVLSRLYQAEQAERAKQGLAVALALTANDEHADELFRLARDERHGESRLLLLDGFKRLTAPGAREMLIELGKERLFQREVERILRRPPRKPKQLRSRAKPQAGSVVTSTSLDVDMLEPFLQRVSAAVHLHPQNMADLLLAVPDLPLRETEEFDLQVGQGQQTTRLLVHVIKSDLEVVEMYFFAPPTVIEEVNDAMFAFFEDAGI